MEVDNYLSIKHAELPELKDLNIIIGPNNCGKTSILRAVNWLSTLTLRGGTPGYTCRICKVVTQKIKNLDPSLNANINIRDKYLTKGKVKLCFGYGKEGVEHLLPELSKRRNSISTSSALDEGTKVHLAKEFEKEQVIWTEVSNNLLIPEHVSPVIWSDFKTAILDHMLFCPDERLQSYKGKQIHEHITSKNLAATDETQLIEYLKEFVDPNLGNIRHNLDLIRTLDKTDFDTPITEQGSGVKSLICLMTDIISESETRIILIDEPELGLSPLGKQDLLRFLLNQCKEKQVFLATHDPTFVNPILWNKENVSVYLYSLIDQNFVKVNLTKSKQDPNSFAGFLPHTTSLKQVHIYVEGTYDVYTFQIFLSRYLKRFRNWYQLINKIGIFHLAGDFWSHLLYTIPKGPYISIVILDGDKTNIATKIVKEYSQIEKNRFQLFGTLEKLSKLKRPRHSNASSPCPIYCLQRSEIEDYLKPRPSKKSGCPTVTYQMEGIPKEIVWLFDIILRWTGKKIEKPSDFNFK
ncbi:MAG: ATP-binding protein [Candidatus Bathyarchaeota archaeon]|nr:ATP-binding protein [Candidatus Bathyarchaeota archaeon]